MTGVDLLSRIFGSRAALARAAEVHPTLVSYWSRKGGDIPDRYKPRLRSALAGMDGVDDTEKVRAGSALEIKTCPTCGRQVD